MRMARGHGEAARRRLARAWDTEKDAANAMAHGICKVLSWRAEVGAAPGPNARLLSPTGPAFAHGKDKALAKLWPSHVAGRDTFGHPVMVERLGAIKFKELRKRFTLADILAQPTSSRSGSRLVWRCGGGRTP